MYFEIKIFDWNGREEPVMSRSKDSRYINLTIKYFIQIY